MKRGVFLIVILLINFGVVLLCSYGSILSFGLIVGNVEVSRLNSVLLETTRSIFLFSIIILAIGGILNYLVFRFSLKLKNSFGFCLGVLLVSSMLVLPAYFYSKAKFMNVQKVEHFNKVK